MPRAAQAAISAVMTGGAAAMSVAAGLLPAALWAGPGRAAMRAAAAGSPRPTAAMAPVPLRAVTAAARAQTTAAAAGRVRIPATAAAAISPWEWPMTASGVMPQAAHSLASAVITANRAGWMTAAP